jgi:hypothetical protein
VTLVRTVPGALSGWTVTDKERTRTSLERELAVLQEADEEWRKKAAERAEAQFQEAELLWGVRPPHLVGAEGGRR